VIVARSCVEREVGYEGAGCECWEARVLMGIVFCRWGKCGTCVSVMATSVIRGQLS
jgi:hypothetical protein